MPRWAPASFVFSLAAGGLLVCTSQPLKAALHSQGRFHPWFHLLSFGVLACLLMGSFRKLAISMLMVACLLAVAWGTEFREHLADGWPVEQKDVLLDVTGIVFGAALGLAGRRLVRSSPPDDF